MPVILSQRAWRDNPKYLDVEGVIYHYPRHYFARLAAHDRFVYYRPADREHARPDERTYFGHGVLGEPFQDPVRPDHRFVGIISYEPFQTLVPLKERSGVYFETSTAIPPQGQAAIRPISELTYYKILAAASASVADVSMSPTTEIVEALGFPLATRQPPLDTLRTADAIPEGTGYVPRDRSVIDIFESAALQERARADHQHILQMIATEITSRGGHWWYDNHIDLYATLGGDKYLIEAKSLNQLRSIVDRMRYGVGQLFDYRWRYKSAIGEVLPVLAFGRPPSVETSWIATMLEDSGVAFVSQSTQRLLPLNNLARQTALFA